MSFSQGVNADRSDSRGPPTSKHITCTEGAPNHGMGLLILGQHCLPLVEHSRCIGIREAKLLAGRCSAAGSARAAASADESADSAGVAGRFWGGAGVF